MLSEAPIVKILTNFIQRTSPGKFAILKDCFKFVADLRLCPGQTIFIHIVILVLEYPIASALRLFEVSTVGFRFFENYDGLALFVLSIGCFYSDAKTVSGVWAIMLPFVINDFETLHGERANSQRDRDGIRFV